MLMKLTLAHQVPVPARVPVVEKYWFTRLSTLLFIIPLKSKEEEGIELPLFRLEVLEFEITVQPCYNSVVAPSNFNMTKMLNYARTEEVAVVVLLEVSNCRTVKHCFWLTIIAYCYHWLMLSTN